MDKKKEFCCTAIESLIEDPESPLEYSSKKRWYSIVSIPKRFRKKNELTIAYTISYCPRCGKKFPKNLYDEWFHIVEKKFGVEDFLDEEGIDNLPQEYKTDEWWKKQGL